MSEWYVLTRPRGKWLNFATEWWLFDMDKVRKERSPRCPLCDSPLGMLSNLPPAELEIEVWGKKPCDIAFGPNWQMLLSHTMMEVVKKHQILGFEHIFQPTIKKVKYHNKRGFVLDEPCYLARIAYSRAMIDDQKSGVVRKKGEHCPECLGPSIKEHKRIVLVEGSWTGEDIFIARGLAGVRVISQRFKDIIDQENLNVIEIIPAEKYSYTELGGRQPIEKDDDEE